MGLLGELHKQGKTVILVTHNNNDALRAERIIELCDGVIINDEKKNVTVV